MIVSKQSTYQLDTAYPFRQADRVPLSPKTGNHYRVICDACVGSYPTIAEVCAKRAEGPAAKLVAVETLRKAGWHVDGIGSGRERWYCPSCGKRSHL